MEWTYSDTSTLLIVDDIWGFDLAMPATNWILT